MPAITQSKNLGDLLKYEAPNLYSREAATVAAGQNLQLGTVLGKKTADGKLYALAPAAADGTETAVSVLAGHRGRAWHAHPALLCHPAHPARRRRAA